MRLFKTIKEIIRHPHPLQRIIASLNNSPIRHLLNGLARLLDHQEASKRSRLASQIQLSEAEEKAVDELKRSGYARLTGLSGLSDLQELGQYGDWATEHKEDFKAKNGPIKKSFWTELVEKRNGRLWIGTNQPLVKFALQDSLVRISSKYLGTFPILNYVLLTLSEHTKEKLNYSQLWHMDRDSINVIKVFVYLTDVKSTDDGPFTFVDAAGSRGVRNSFFLRHLPDGDFFRSAKKSDVKEMTGSRYEVFAVDTTRCYHMGSRVAEGRSRLMYTALYLPYVSPYFQGETDPLFRLEPGLTAEQRMLFRSKPYEVPASSRVIQGSET
jgi:hypothetical protein